MSYTAIETENQLLQLKKAGLTGGRLIACVGDSITFGYTVPRSACWCTLAGQMTGNRLINLGQCGDTTGGMAARAAGLAEVSGLDAVAVMGGGNDLMMGVPASVIRENLLGIARKAAENGAAPIVCLFSPVTPAGVPQFFTYPPYFADSDEFDAARRALDESLREAAAKEGWLCVDFTPALTRPDGTADPALYNDNVHPNAAGHRRMAEVFAAALRELFPGEETK